MVWNWEFFPIHCCSIEQLDKQDPPSLPDQYLVYLVLTSINHISENIAALVLPVYLGVGPISNGGASQTTSAYNPSQSILSPLTGTFVSINPIELRGVSERHPLAKELVLSAKMISSSSNVLLGAFANFIAAPIDADLFHSLMKAYQNMILTAGR